MTAEMLTKDLQGPLDTLDGLGDEEMEALRGWEERFLDKYLVVGRLVAVGYEGKTEKTWWGNVVAGYLRDRTEDGDSMTKSVRKPKANIEIRF